MRVAILDDYQQVALASADWSAVRQQAEIYVFTQHIARTDALVSALEPFDVVVAMRERTAFDAERLGRLPRLRLLVTTGMANASIDMDRGAARGITVCGTTASPVLHGRADLGAHPGPGPAHPRGRPADEDRRAGRRGGAERALRLAEDGRHRPGRQAARRRRPGKQGPEVAEIGRAFGMKVVAWSQNLDPDHARKAHAKAVGKEDLFATSDVVTVHYKLARAAEGWSALPSWP